jgi:hypothetical protein
MILKNRDSDYFSINNIRTKIVAVPIFKIVAVPIFPKLENI